MNPEIETGILDAATEAAYLKEIAEPYGIRLNTVLYYVNDGSSVFTKKMKKAENAYAKLEASEFPILLFDSTVLGSAKEGFVMTSQNFYVQFAKKDLITVKLNEIEKLTVQYAGSKKEWHSLTATLKTGEMALLARTIEGKRLPILTLIFKQMIEHMYPDADIKIENQGTMPE